MTDFHPGATLSPFIYTPLPQRQRGHGEKRFERTNKAKNHVPVHFLFSMYARFHIEFRADAPDEFRPPAFCGEHPGQKKQIARLHRLHIGTERLWGRLETYAKFFQPLFGAGRPRDFAGCRFHLLFRICIHLSRSCLIESVETKPPHQRRGGETIGRWQQRAAGMN